MVAAFTLDGSPLVTVEGVDDAVGEGEAVDVADDVADDVAVGVALAVELAVAAGFAVVVAVAVAAEPVSLADCASVDAFVLAEAVAVGDEVGVAVEDALALPLALGDGDGLGLAGLPVYGSVRSTCRNESWAVEVIRLTKSFDSSPGTVTVIWLLPTCCTWAPELPVPLTRDSRTVTAVCMSPLDGAPFVVAAFSTSSVPLDRSSPRPTLN
jgi:hypothetical protein